MPERKRIAKQTTTQPARLSQSHRVSAVPQKFDRTRAESSRYTGDGEATKHKTAQTRGSPYKQGTEPQHSETNTRARQMDGCRAFVASEMQNAGTRIHIRKKTKDNVKKKTSDFLCLDREGKRAIRQQDRASTFIFFFFLSFSESPDAHLAMAEYEQPNSFLLMATRVDRDR